MFQIALFFKDIIFGLEKLFVFCISRIYWFMFFVVAAAAMGTDLIARVPGGDKKSRSSYMSKYPLTEEGGIANCPMRHAPIEDAARGKHREVVFAVEHCQGYLRRKDCPVESVR